MYKIKCRIVALLCLFIWKSGLAQTSRFADKQRYLLDSVDLQRVPAGDKALLDKYLNVYHKAADDTTRLKQLGFLANELETTNLWFAYAKELEKETKIALQKRDLDPVVRKRLYALAGTAAHSLGYYYFQVVRIDSISERYNLASIEFHREGGKQKSIALDMFSLAGNYSTEGRVKEAIDYTEQALSLFENVKDTNHVAACYQNIGYMLQQQNDTEGALKKFRKALALYTAIGRAQDMADCYSFIGTCYKTKKMYDSALYDYAKAYTIFDTLKNDYGIATVLLNRGEVYQNQGDLDAALGDYRKSLALFEESNDKNPISFALNSLAIIYYRKGDYASARSAGERSLQLSQEIHYPDNIRNAAKILSSVYKTTGDYKQALAMHELYAQMNDSILNADTKRDAIEKDLKYQHERELLEVQKEREKEAIAAQKEKEKRNIIIVSISVGMLLLLVFFVFLYNRFRFIREQKQIIEQQKAEVEQQRDIIGEKNHEILDSIQYARRLQHAILPQRRLVAEYLPQSFVLYKPKDIVAGDFYWVEKTGEHVIVAAADCTGHGVPGAMVSFVCVNALNRSVLEFGLLEPAAILDKTSELVVEAFRRSEDQVKDGMDISLCVLNTRTNVLQYAGAYNPLWILRKGAEDLEEHTATRQAVGNVLSPVPFVNNTISLSSGDCLYLFSDGYADQFGGPKGKKLKYSNFKRILLENASLPMQEQSAKLEQEFESWKGALEQVDDVCVIGVRIE